MKERPILFSGPMVCAILDGRKTQTRRVLKGSAEFKGPYNPAYLEMHRNAPGWKTICPYGQPGDRLWVKETCFIWGRWRRNGITPKGLQRWRFKIETPRIVVFDAKHPQVATRTTPRETCMYWKRPSIFMPRWASRITLEIAEVRVQRLQEISEADATAEGVAFTKYLNANARLHFKELWDSINGKTHPWDSNPWLWVLTFKRIEAIHVGA